jgi:hypothetical protein
MSQISQTSQRPKRRCVEDAMNRVREVLEWERLDERSAQFRSVAQALEEEFERERLMRRTCPEILEEYAVENDDGNDGNDGNDNDDEDSGASEASCDSDWHPGKKGGGFFRYDGDEESNVEVSGESESEEPEESEEPGEVITISDDLGDDTETEDLSDTETIVHCDSFLDNGFYEGSIASSNGSVEREALEAEGESILSSLEATGNATACEEGGPSEMTSSPCLETPEP